MRKRLFSTVILFAMTALLHAADWGKATRPRVVPPQPGWMMSQGDTEHQVKSTIKGIMTGTQYIAIVYPTAMKGGEDEHSSHEVRATVEYTVYGKAYTTIVFNSYGAIPIPNYPILVGLCTTAEPGEFYAPDLGYEISATAQVIKLAKRYTGLKPKPVERVCRIR